MPVGNAYLENLMILYLLSSQLPRVDVLLRQTLTRILSVSSVFCIPIVTTESVEPVLQ